jgi:hypothetical protein
MRSDPTARQGGVASRSGSGSTLGATAELRRALPRLLARHGIASLLDAPCGDFHWACEVAWGEVRYVGVDIVADIVAENRRRHAARRRRFARADIVQDPLPAAAAILCRDCLPHLSVEDIGRALGNFRRTGARLLITTTAPHVAANRPIPTGYYRPLNLQIAPFHFPPPIELLPDGSPEKALGVWRQADLPRL